MLMRDERRKEERSEQGQTNNKAKQNNTPKVVTFYKRKMSCLECMYIFTHIHEKADDSLEFHSHFGVAYLLHNQHSVWRTGPVEMVFTGWIFLHLGKLCTPGHGMQVIE